MEFDLDQRVSHPRGRFDRGAGGGVYARQRHRIRAGRRWTRGSTSTCSGSASRSSSTSTTTFSKKWPSSAPLAACGPASCGIGLAPPKLARNSCGFTRKQPGARSLPNNPTTTSRAWLLQALAAVLGRHAVPPLQRSRRGARSSDGGERDNCAPNAADPPSRDRRRVHGRSGRRRVRDRGKDDRIEHEATQILERIEPPGGTLSAIESGLIQREIQDSAYRAQQALERGTDIVVVGVNRYNESAGKALGVFSLDPSVERDRWSGFALSARAEARASASRRSTAVERAARGGRQPRSCGHRGGRETRDARRDFRRPEERVRRVSGHLWCVSDHDAAPRCAAPDGDVRAPGSVLTAVDDLSLDDRGRRNARSRR